MDTDHSRGPTMGVVFGLVLFVVTGAIPSLLYGGYLAVLVASLISGDTVQPTEASRWMILGGMVTGFVAVCSLYVVVGALIGGLVEGAWRAARKGEGGKGTPPPEAEP